jgi:5-(carboxyamino)imidazole ribonucleotide mutase
MPGGVPVATVALNGAKNAGLLAAQIIGSTNAKIGQAMDDYKLNMESEVMTKVENLKGTWNNEFDQK